MIFFQFVVLSVSFSTRVSGPTFSGVRPLLTTDSNTPTPENDRRMSVSLETRNLSWDGTGAQWKYRWNQYRQPSDGCNNYWPATVKHAPTLRGVSCWVQRLLCVMCIYEGVFIINERLFFYQADAGWVVVHKDDRRLTELCWQTLGAGGH